MNQHHNGGISEVTDQEIEAALATAEASFQSWYRKSPGERASVISKAAGILRARGEEFARPVIEEMGSLLERARQEVALSADVIDYYAKNSNSLKNPERDEADSVNLGIIFGIHPDSSPYFQLARLAAPNLMAGNVVMVKHTGSVPPSALAFEKLWLEAGAPVGTYTNLPVSNEQFNRLMNDPRIKPAFQGGVEALTRTAGK